MFVKDAIITGSAISSPRRAIKVLYQDKSATDDIDVEIIKIDDDIIEQVKEELMKFESSQLIMMGLWRVGYLLCR